MQRLATYGEKKLVEAVARPLWLKFVDQFRNFLVIVLLFAAGLAICITGTAVTREAATLAFTTFVLFQFFNVFNARSKHSTVFNKNFFSNGKLWLALGAVLGMQVLAVQWAPALLLDEGRKLLMGLAQGKRMARV